MTPWSTRMPSFEVEPDIRVVELCRRFDLHVVQDIGGVLDEVLHGVDIARVERESYHRLYAGEVNLDDAVVVRDRAGRELLVFLGTAVNCEIPLCLVVCHPDGGKTGGLGCHNIDAVPELDREIRDAVSDELENLVLDESALKDSADYSERDVLRTDAGLRLAAHVDADDLRALDVIGAAEELLHELRSALADRHRSERAVARVAVGAEDHLSAAAHHLAHIRVNDRDVRRDIDAAVLLRGGETEYMVVLIDCAADRAEAVVTVGEYVRERELFESAGTGGLDYADICDIMRRHRVEFDFQILVVSAVVSGEDRPRHRSAARLLFCYIILAKAPQLVLRSAVVDDERVAVREISAFPYYFHHDLCSLREKLLYYI